jgi:polar amino acid transport system substrate-binding protein
VRRTAAFVAALSLVAGLAACGSSDKKTESGSGATTTAAAGCKTYQDAYVKDVGAVSDFKPVTADTLTIVTSLPGPGFWEGSDDDPTKITSGFEYDIVKAMQQAFGLSKLVVRNEGFDAIVAGTVTNYDIALSQVTITCERAAVVKFTTPYFESNQGMLVRKGTKITSLADCKKLQWGAQTGTTALDLIKKIPPEKETKVFQNLADAYTALEAEQIDAVLIDTAINLGEAARSKHKFEVVAQFEQPGGPDHYGALLPKDTTNAGAVNAVFKQLTDSGQLADLAKKDLTADPGNILVIPTP